MTVAPPFEMIAQTSCRSWAKTKGHVHGVSVLLATSGCSSCDTGLPLPPRIVVDSCPRSSIPTLLLVCATFHCRRGYVPVQRDTFRAVCRGRCRKMFLSTVAGALSCSFCLLCQRALRTATQKRAMAPLRCLSELPCWPVESFSLVCVASAPCVPLPDWATTHLFR